MKTPKEYVASFDATKPPTIAEVELLVANVLLDANDYKDRIINALFRLKNGEAESAEKLVYGIALPLPEASKSRKPVVSYANEGEKTDAVAGVVAVDSEKSTGEIPPVTPVKAGRQKVIEFPPVAEDEKEVKATKRVVGAPMKAVRGGKNASNPLPSVHEDPLTPATSKSLGKSKSVVAPTDEPAAPPLGKAGLPPGSLGRTGPVAPGKYNGKPAPKRPVKR